MQGNKGVLRSAAMLLWVLQRVLGSTDVLAALAARAVAMTPESGTVRAYQHIGYTQLRRAMPAHGSVLPVCFVCMPAQYAWAIVSDLPLPLLLLLLLLQIDAGEIEVPDA
jgi:hypothetical protein